jgi:hypothetical protein
VERVVVELAGVLGVLAAVIVVGSVVSVVLLLLLLLLVWRLLLPPLVLVRVLSVMATLLLWVVEKEAEVLEEWGWWRFRLWFARWER